MDIWKLHSCLPVNSLLKFDKHYKFLPSLLSITPCKGTHCHTTNGCSQFSDAGSRQINDDYYRFIVIRPAYNVNINSLLIML